MRIAFDVQKFSAEKRRESDAVFAVCRGGIWKYTANRTEVFGTETDEEGMEEGDEDMKDTDKEDKASTKKARRGVSKDTKEKNEVSGEQTCRRVA